MSENEDVMKNILMKTTEILEKINDDFKDKDNTTDDDFVFET